VYDEQNDRNKLYFTLYYEKQLKEHCMREKFNMFNDEYERLIKAVEIKNKKVNEHKVMKEVTCDMDSREMFLNAMYRPLPMKFINAGI
jgi:hypothetical protein